MTANTPPNDQALVVLHRETHGHLRLNRQKPDYGFVRGAVTVALTAAEVPAACMEYPCVMARQPDGRWRMLAVTGLKARQNVFVGDVGARLGGYLPLSLSTWPFRLVNDGNEQGRFLVAVQPSALSTTEGDPLFDASAQESPWLLERLRELTQTDAGMLETSDQLAALDAAGVLSERTFQAVLGDGSDVELHGFLTVDEARLQALPEKTVHELHVSGALALAYLHLLSLRRFRALVARAGELAERAEASALA